MQKTLFWWGTAFVSFQSLDFVLFLPQFFGETSRINRPAFEPVVLDAWQMWDSSPRSLDGITGNLVKLPEWCSVSIRGMFQGQQTGHWRFQHFIYLLSCIPNILGLDDQEIDWMNVIFLEWVEAPSGRCAVWSPFHCPSWKASTEHIKTRIWGFAIYFSMTWTCICLVVCRLGRKKVTHIELEVHVYTCM